MKYIDMKKKLYLLNFIKGKLYYVLFLELKDIVCYVKMYCRFLVYVVIFNLG